jgi:hypothetical protein
MLSLLARRHNSDIHVPARINPLFSQVLRCFKKPPLLHVQNSINGERLRRFELGGKRITALGFIGIDFTFDHRIVLVGCEDGAVIEVATDFLSGQLSVRREVSASEYRIARFIANRGTNIVDVLDGIGMKSVCK